MQGVWIHIWSLGREDLLEKGMATHSSILAWEIPWTDDPCWLQSRGFQKSQTWLRNWACTQFYKYPAAESIILKIALYRVPFLFPLRLSSSWIPSQALPTIGTVHWSQDLPLDFLLWHPIELLSTHITQISTLPPQFGIAPDLGVSLKNLRLNSASPKVSLRWLIKHNDELPLKTQFVAGMGREPESIHLHGYANSAGCLLPDIVWDSGSHAGWASSRGHRSAYTIAFPERQTLPYLFYDSLGACSLLEFTQGKESSQQNKVCLLPCVWPAYVIFWSFTLQVFSSLSLHFVLCVFFKLDLD